MTPDFNHTPAPVETLIAALWRERELLERLLFALTTQQLLLESPPAVSARWLATASAQVSELTETLREREIVRAMAIDELATELELLPSTSLLGVAETVGGPCREILLDLRTALRGLVREIDGAVRRNDRLLLGLVRPGSGDPPASTR